MTYQSVLLNNRGSTTKSECVSQTQTHETPQISERNLQHLYCPARVSPTTAMAWSINNQSSRRLLVGQLTPQVYAWCTLRNLRSWVYWVLPPPTTQANFGRQQRQSFTSPLERGRVAQDKEHEDYPPQDEAVWGGDVLRQVSAKEFEHDTQLRSTGRPLE